MAQYTIGEVEKITGVKSHILRYWEEVIPSIAPKKNIAGRRTYSMRDVQLIMKLRYLIQEKKFTIEGARNCLIENAVISDNKEVSQVICTINELRSDLIELYTIVRREETE